MLLQLTWYNVRYMQTEQTIQANNKQTQNVNAPMKEGRKCLFHDALNTFYLRLYGVRHMVKDHSDSERGNQLLPYELLFPIISKGSFIWIIPQTG